MQNDEGHLKKRVSEWIQQQGYPLEMQVAGAFQKADFHVRLSDVYHDFDTGKSREIDVTAVRFSSLDEPASLQICWCIECKHSPEKPWVVFVSEAQRERVLPFELICSDIYQTFLFEAMQQDTLRSELLGIDLLKAGPICHGIARAFAPEEDVPFKAAMSAAKSAFARVLRVDELNKQRGPGAPFFCCLGFPLIVIDARLFECSLGPDETPILQEVFAGVVEWKGDHPLSSSALIYIVTKPVLGQFVDQVDSASRALIEFTHANMTLLTKRIPQGPKNAAPSSETS